MEDEKPHVEEDMISLQSIEMTMTLEEEREKTSDYEGSHNSNEQITPESDNVRGIINPVYQNSDETVLKLAEQDISTNEQAKEHLSELTKMLNKEDDQAPKPDYEIVDIVTEDTKRPDPAPDYIDVMHTTNQNTHPPKADYVNISSVDSNEVKYPPKADYANITSADSNEVNNTKQDEYMPTKHEECTEGEDTGLVYVDTPHIDYENDGAIDQPSFISNREFDEESGELIISSDEKRKASSSSPSNHGYANGTITADVNSDQTDDLLDEEPDVDYNDKQVRFASVVLDTEENKFEPIKSENSKTPSDGESFSDGESQLADEMRNELTLEENGNVSDIPDEEITEF